MGRRKWPSQQQAKLLPLHVLGDVRASLKRTEMHPCIHPCIFSAAALDDGSKSVEASSFTFIPNQPGLPRACHSSCLILANALRYCQIRVLTSMISCSKHSK